jgi:hypothetical protein
MKTTRRANKPTDGMRSEYRFDYTRARPNRFSQQLQGKVVTVVLEPDVAKVFDSSESVNRLLRSVISAVPKRKNRVATSKPRRKAS